VSTKVIEVRIWNTLVGAVALDPNLACYVFEYDPQWRRRGVELAPRTMPTTAPQPAFVFPALGASFQRLPGLLADALPDEFGNTLIDAWMARHGVVRDSITPLDRLAYMGRRGLGALEFRPVLGAMRESARPLEMKSLVEAARGILHGDFKDDLHAQAALANIIRVGTSAGGARAKAVIAWNPATQEMRSGQFDAAEGFEHWLLKFDGVGNDLELGSNSDYGRIEYAYHLMATCGAGIEMSPCRLLEEHGRAHFMTRRFDRDGNAKHHIQSLCALAHLDFMQRATHAYEQYFMVIRDLRLGDQALDQGFRRMAFNVMARNCDDHTKNLGFRLKQAGEWELAPAYDVTHAHNPKGEWTSQHLMSVNGKFDDIGRADLLAVADRFAVPDASKALAAVKECVQGWPQFAKEAGVDPANTTRIADDFRVG
jgi:serine/threonine-protein kinase HipA